MTKTQLERQKDGTIKITISLPQDKIKAAQDTVIDELAKQTNVAGFRKGKAPKEMALNRLNPEQVREEILKRLLPQAYIEAVQEHKLNPIMNPKMHVETIEEDGDVIFYALTCEMPTIELGKYREYVKKVSAKSKIIIPGKEEEAKKSSLEEIMK